MIRPCRRCLLADLPEEAALAELLRQRIASLPEEERAPETLEQSRLAACRVCPFLNHGTCGQCGCYVEIRAARLRMGCPDVPSRWPEEKATNH